MEIPGGAARELTAASLAQRYVRHPPASMSTTPRARSHHSRPTISGDIDDNDVFGGQQYGPLVDLDVP